MQSLVLGESVAWCSAGIGIFNVVEINFSRMGIVCCNPGKTTTEV